MKSQSDLKLVWKRKNNTYVEENTNRAFQLELLVSQIRLAATRSDPNRSIETCVQQIVRCAEDLLHSSILKSILLSSVTIICHCAIFFDFIRLYKYKIQSIGNVFVDIPDFVVKYSHLSTRFI